MSSDEDAVPGVDHFAKYREELFSVPPSEGVRKLELAADCVLDGDVTNEREEASKGDRLVAPYRLSEVERVVPLKVGLESSERGRKDERPEACYSPRERPNESTTELTRKKRSSKVRSGIALISA